MTVNDSDINLAPLGASKELWLLFVDWRRSPKELWLLLVILLSNIYVSHVAILGHSSPGNVQHLAGAPPGVQS